jgi:hypothetical protein
VRDHQQKKLYVNFYSFLKFHSIVLNFYLADEYFENLHDPMEEPSANILIDEHQDAAYPIATWKCKSLSLVFLFLQLKGRHFI